MRVGPFIIARRYTYEAIRALEFAGVLTWVNRITRIQVRERDLFGKWASRVASDPHLERL